MGILWLSKALEHATDAGDQDLQSAIKLNLNAWSWQIHPMTAPPLDHGPILSVVFGNDGKAVFTASNDYSVKMWDTATSRQIGPSFMHQGAVHSLAISPNGKMLITGDDHKAYLWDVSTRKKIGPALPHRARVVSVGVSADGKYVATGSDDRTAKIWTAPVPFEGEVERIALWASLVTGLEINSDGMVQAIRANSWIEHQKRLRDVGGTPVKSRPSRSHPG
jgi:WD40 repeat protein